jgi:hypothetical protein
MKRGIISLLFFFFPTSSSFFFPKNKEGLRGVSINLGEVGSSPLTPP